MESNLFNYTAVLYALGWAIAHSLWQMGLLWLLYQLFFGLHKNQKPALRYGGAITLITGGFAWFILTFVQQFRHYQLFNRYLEQLPVTDTELTPVNLLNTQTGGLPDLTTLFSVFEKFIPFLSAGYLIILIFLSIRFVNAYGYTQQLRHTGIIPAGDYFNERMQSLISRMGLPSNIRLYFSEIIDVPATIGFLKPVILLPVATVTQLSPEQVEAIIIHELAHIRRQDYLMNMIVAVMETILFFNPFAHLLTVSLKKERELFCDDFVVSFNKNPENYATALLCLEKMRKGQELVLAVAATGHDGVLLSRVKRILNVKTNSIQYKEKIIALIFISLLLSTLAWLDPVPEKKLSVKDNRNNESLKLVKDDEIVSNVAELIRKDYPTPDSLKSIVRKTVKQNLRTSSTPGQVSKKDLAAKPETTSFYTFSLPEEFIAPPAVYDFKYRTPDLKAFVQDEEELKKYSFSYTYDQQQQTAADSIIRAEYLAQRGAIGKKEYLAYLDKIKDLKAEGLNVSPWFLQKMTALYRNEMNNTRNLQRSRVRGVIGIPERTIATTNPSIAPETGFVEVPGWELNGKSIQNSIRETDESLKLNSGEAFEIAGFGSNVHTNSDVRIATKPTPVIIARKKSPRNQQPTVEEGYKRTPSPSNSFVTVHGYASNDAAHKRNTQAWSDNNIVSTDTARTGRKVAVSVAPMISYGYSLSATGKAKAKTKVSSGHKTEKQKIVIYIETENQAVNIVVDPEEN